MADQATKPSFIRRHPVISGFLLLLILLCLGLGGGAWFLATADYRGLLEQRLTAKLGRPVRIGSVTIGWGNPLRLELQDISLANIAGGSTPDMATIKTLSASIDLAPLLHRQLHLRSLRVDTPVITLERDAAGHGNWLLAGAQEPPPGSEPPNAKVGDEPKPAAVAPSGRADFPVLLDFALSNGMVTYRTFSGHQLRIDLREVAIRTGGAGQPVELSATGAYNGSDLALQATTGSFNDLRDVAKPLDTSFAITHQSAKVTFNGTMTDPLNVDGASGILRIETAKLSDILAVFHTSLGVDPAARLEARLTRQNDLWHFADAKGDIGGNSFTGQLHLLEGRHGGSDDLQLAMDFDELALDALLPPQEKNKSGSGLAGWRDLALDAPDKTAPRLAAAFSASKVKYRSFDLADLRLSGSLAPGAITLDRASLALGGISLELSGALKAAALTVMAKVREADFQALAKLLGGATTDLSGKITAGIDLALHGKTLGDGLKNSKGGAVLSMASGRISRDLLEKASTDLRNIFRKGEGTAKVDCLLAVMRLENGIGVLAPVRLRSSAATLNAAGRINFLDQSLDLTLQSDRNSTGFLALDMPVRLSGPWSQPKAGLSNKGSLPAGGNPLSDLSPDLQGIAAANACRP